MYRIREDHSRQYLAALSFRSAFMFRSRCFVQDIISTFRAFYFVLYGEEATGSCSVEYPMFLMYRLSTKRDSGQGGLEN